MSVRILYNPLLVAPGLGFFLFPSATYRVPSIVRSPLSFVFRGRPPHDTSSSLFIHPNRLLT